MVIIESSIHFCVNFMPFYLQKLLLLRITYCDMYKQRIILIIHFEMIYINLKIEKYQYNLIWHKFGY